MTIKNRHLVISLKYENENSLIGPNCNLVSKCDLKCDIDIKIRELSKVFSQICVAFIKNKKRWSLKCFVSK